MLQKHIFYYHQPKYGPGKNGGTNGGGNVGGKNGPKPGKNGKNGGATGVTEFDGSEGKESITVLFSFTVKVYAVPLVKPVTVIGELDELAVILPGFEIAVYSVPSGFPKYGGGVN